MNKKEMHRFLVDADLARIAYQIDVEDYYDLALLERRLQRWNEEEANGTIQWNDDGTPIRFSDDGYELGSIRNGKASIIKQIENIKKYGIALMIAKFLSISSVSFTFGNGTFTGTSIFRNSHKGSQPSFI